MPLLLGPGLGHERISREALIVLADNLNAQLAVEDAKWATLDAALAAKVQQNYVVCTSDIVQPSNFYFGHRPTLVEAPISGYPNVSCYSNLITPNADQGDHTEGTSIALTIEAMVIDGPYPQLTSGFNREGEELTNKKLYRMTESIHNVITDFNTLNGLVPPIQLPPRVEGSELFMRRENTSHGEDYYWQMVRLTYSVAKVSSLY